MSPGEDLPAAPESRFADRFGAAAQLDLRRHTARGTIVNGAFTVGVSALAVVRGVALAAILTTTAYGDWGLLLAALSTVFALGAVGLDDKYIQQDHPDQRAAFEIAFTLHCCLCAMFAVLLLGGMPLFALLYDRPEIIGPGMLIAAGTPGIAMQTPVWVHYRRMNFVRQRALQSIDPAVTLVAMVALALAGFGVWGLVVGALIGIYATAFAAVVTSPYRLRFRWDRAALRDYTSFSWPLFVTALIGVLLVQVPVSVAARELGVAAVAALALTALITQFTGRVNDIITQTLYPAICAVKERTDLLFESFWKSNRLALLWAAPGGAAIALFADDFVRFVIGSEWRYASGMLAWFGIFAAISQIAFNWSAFFRARGDTRPIAIESGVSFVAVMAIAVPLLALEGLTAFGIAMAGIAVITVWVRLWFIKRLFPMLGVLLHIARGFGPTLLGVAAVLTVRLVDTSSRGVTQAIAELLLFVCVTIVGTLLGERALLRESLGYLRRSAVAAPV